MAADAAPQVPITSDWLLACLGASPDYICVVSPEGLLLFASHYAPGLTADDVIGRSIYEFLDARSHEAARACLDEVLATRRPGFFESVAATARGGQTFFETRVAPLVRGDQVAALTLVATDISGRKRTETALREGEERLRLAVVATRLGLWSWDPITDAITWDDRMSEIFGITATQAPKRIADLTALFHPDDHAAVAERVSQARSEPGATVTERLVLRPSGETRVARVHALSVRGPDGRVVKVVGAALDITDERALERRLRESQKLEAVGQLTAGIAHNFNNLLGIILAGLDVAARDAGGHSATVLAETRGAAERGAAMVRDLLTFAGAHRGSERRTQSLAPLVERTAGMARATFGSAIEVACVLAPQVPDVHVDAHQIEQVLLNLCLNARDAMQATPAKRLTLELATRPPEGPGSSVAPWACVEVRDTGCGMDAATQSRVFEPFFTTKPPGQGTGLGLATAYAIVRDHAGSLCCESCVGSGTVFRMSLPPAP